MNKKSVIPGVIIITISLILFAVAVSGTIPFPPTSIMRNSIIFTFLTIILWSLFIIILSFLWTILNDRIILGEVRWLMIFSMILLICGSYLFYRAKSYNIPDMLTFTGKRMKQGNDIMKKAMNITEKTEQTGTDMIKKLWKR